MNGQETVLFLAMLRAAFPGSQPVAGQGAVWERMLADVTLEEAELALTSWGRVEDRIPSAAAIRSYVRASREQEAQRRTAQVALESDGRRHRMPEWVRVMAAEYRAANAGKYRELHEARRRRQAEEGRQLAPWEPMPGVMASGRSARQWRESVERSPQDRAAGPDT